MITRCLCCIVLLALAWPARAQLVQDDDLRRMSLDDLLAVELTTATRTPVVPARSPVAVTVLTRDDIRRSGARTLTQLLQSVPGVHVAAIDHNKTAVGIRGFTDRLSRGMLVMIDGRTVYTPLFAGTYWEMQHTLLDDVERIEIVRGPGGTLWGANAVNGIINIVTRHAATTQGVLLSASAGNVERGMLSGRYGGRIGTDGAYRVYGTWFNRGPGAHQDRANFDDWQLGQGGFRADWTRSASRTLTVQGDAYTSTAGQRLIATTYTAPFSQVLLDDVSMSGANLLTRWSSGPRTGRNFVAQVYIDRTRRDEALFDETRHTFDADVQQHLARMGRHRLLWGAGYRVSSDRTASVPIREFQPAARTLRLFSGFLQDEVMLQPERLELVLGTRVEHNDFSGWEVQPTSRLIWTLAPAHSVVVSAARAVRTPSRVERDYTTGSLLNAQVPFFLRLEPNAEFDTEKFRAYEVGYRGRLGRRTFTTISTFYNHLDDILSTRAGAPFAEAVQPPRLILPVSFGNDLHGNSHGVEATADIHLTSWWRSTASYSALRVQLTPDATGMDVSQEVRAEGGSPTHMAHVRSAVDLPGDLELDWHWRFVDGLPALDIPPYATSNLRVAWHATPHWTVEVVGRDIHRASHLEFTGGSAGDVRVRRGVYARIVSRW